MVSLASRPSLSCVARSIARCSRGALLCFCFAGSIASSIARWIVCCCHCRAPNARFDLAAIELISCCCSLLPACPLSCPEKLPPMYPGQRYFIYAMIDADKASFANTFDIKVMNEFLRVRASDPSCLASPALSYVTVVLDSCLSVIR